MLSRKESAVLAFIKFQPWGNNDPMAGMTHPHRTLPANITTPARHTRWIIISRCRSFSLGCLKGASTSFISCNPDKSFYSLIRMPEKTSSYPDFGVYPENAMLFFLYKIPEGSRLLKYHPVLSASRYVTMRCRSSSHKHALKQSTISPGESEIVTGDWSSGMAAIASGRR
jgi:hypothetical protein